MPPTRLPRTLRERTVMPRTKPTWQTMRYPAISQVVATIIDFSLGKPARQPAF
jgi:hypothetical protein